ncbi:hypothetical protein QR90_01255 [Deinococcus radiopugnans]|uniref:Uncharacterized protein n=1 Tax=Deinococcus radiopugnans TaxID=57497 RepID=A0A0A7KHL7_9DEIO|nr:hypothetical protein [Deinococcus radiopugnans]AIZ44043.1 hypothetical protein QR90_01255 [Deinococcus radiopugnans]
MSVLYLLLTLAFAGVLLALLVRPAARAGIVWGLAALLPLLAAMTGALSVQARSARTLAAYPAGPVTLTISDGIFKRAVVLDFMDAACVERAVRLRSEAILSTPGGPLRLGATSQVEGAMPPRAVVEALTLRGELTCPNLKAVRERKT